jgi:hypothetical protein
MKNLTTSLFFMLSILLTGCVTTESPVASYQSPYPGNSSVAVSPLLEKEAIEGLGKYLKDTQGIDSFEILKRESYGPPKEIYINGRGQLVAGELHEIWTIKHSGTVQKHEFIMYSDGNLGNSMGFKKHEG